jgi:hypothetical protein
VAIHQQVDTRTSTRSTVSSDKRRGLSWNQAICTDCWVRQHRNRIPVRMREQEWHVECCALCGRLTANGVFVRADPLTVPFPRADDDE